MFNLPEEIDSLSLFQQLSITGCSFTRGGTSHLVPPLILWLDLAWAWTSPVQSITTTVTYTQLSCSIQKTLIPGSHRPLLTLTLFTSPLPQRSLSPCSISDNHTTTHRNTNCASKEQGSSNHRKQLFESILLRFTKKPSRFLMNILKI